MEKMIISLKDENGNMKDYETVCTMESNDNKNKYICYTDNTRDEEGHIKIYISAYVEENGEMKAFPIVTQEEWEWVKNKFNGRTDI